MHKSNAWEAPLVKKTSWGRWWWDVERERERQEFYVSLQISPWSASEIVLSCLTRKSLPSTFEWKLLLMMRCRRQMRHHSWHHTLNILVEACTTTSLGNKDVHFLSDDRHFSWVKQVLCVSSQDTSSHWCAICVFLWRHSLWHQSLLQRQRHIEQRLPLQSPIHY
jgi:hypothetical protein